MECFLAHKDNEVSQAHVHPAFPSQGSLSTWELKNHQSPWDREEARRGLEGVICASPDARVPMWNLFGHPHTAQVVNGLLLMALSLLGKIWDLAIVEWPRSRREDNGKAFTKWRYPT